MSALLSRPVLFFAGEVPLFCAYQERMPVILSRHSFTLRGFARASRSLRSTFASKPRMLQPADLGGASEIADHGDSELVLKQLHTQDATPNCQSALSRDVRIRLAILGVGWSHSARP